MRNPLRVLVERLWPKPAAVVVWDDRTYGVVAVEDPTPDEPLCCGEPMVHNSWTEEYECSAAYFALEEAGWGDFLHQTTAEDVGPELAKTLAHWRASCISDTPWMELAGRG